MKKLFFLFLALFVGSQAEANLTLKLDLESKLQEKLKALMTPFDPYAQIVVTARLKKLVTALPGTGIQDQEVISTETSTSLSTDDVESIEIRVATSLEPFPDAMKSLLESAVDLPKSKKNLLINTLDPKMMDLAREGSPTRPWQQLGQHLTSLENKIWGGIPLILIILIGIPLLFLGFSIFKDFRNRTLQSQLISQIVSELKTGVRQESAPQIRPEIHATESPAARSSGRDFSTEAKNSISSLSPEALVALLSDCYWCKEDAYAAWIWSNMQPSQHQAVLKLWSAVSNYISCITQVEKQPANFHEHPYYLSPLPLADVSQENLGPWIQKNPEFWHSLSPLRKAKIEIPILEKIKIQNTPGSDQTPKFTLPKSKKRDMIEPLNFGLITEQDELAIYEDSEKVPQTLRKAIPSLVWVALLEAKDRKEILSRLNAQELAEAWIGPEKILTRLEESIDAKKLQLMKSYLKRTSPSRTSPALAFLVQTAVEKLTPPAESKTVRKISSTKAA